MAAGFQSGADECPGDVSVGCGCAERAAGVVGEANRGDDRAVVGECFGDQVCRDAVKKELGCAEQFAVVVLPGQGERSIAAPSSDRRAGEVIPVVVFANAQLGLPARLGSVSGDWFGYLIFDAQADADAGSAFKLRSGQLDCGHFDQH
jgi:hypothetical protein